ncbi:MAG: hypothetical protein JWO78_80 [Micavibrio sp.]|nr:hypothetical protein [Micavibrio sp.]
MKKMLFLAMLLTPVLAPALSYAQTAPVTNAPGKPVLHKQADFGYIKGRSLDRVAKKIAELQARQQCIQSADTIETLEACREKPATARRK